MPRKTAQQEQYERDQEGFDLDREDALDEVAALQFDDSQSTDAEYEVTL